MSAAFFSPAIPTTLPTLSANTHFSPRPQLFSLLPKQNLSLSLARSAGNGAGPVVGSAAVEEKAEAKEAKPAPDFVEKVKKEEALDANGAVVEDQAPPKFMDKRWVAGTWDLTQFGKDGKTDWDAVIDAEARRRKWLEDNPEASSNDEPVVFDTAIIPWWAWIKRYHLPEAELLNGRAAMIGFFMAYFVDSLTGIGLVGQTGNFFCKTLLFIAVAGVLLIRKNEDIETLKKLIDESTFYDKQWQATWQDDTPSDSKE